MSDKKENEKGIGKTTRRGFIAGSTGFAAGLALGSSGLSMLSTEVSAQTVDEGAPYQRLDPTEVRETAYEKHISGLECCEGVFNGLTTVAREEIGEPYTEIPTVLTSFGAGGGAGWGKVCGAANGGAIFISLVGGRTAATKTLVDEFWRWYTQHPFPQYDPPSDAAEYADEDLPTSVSNSVDCHVSVTEWSKEAGLASDSPLRSERCHRVTADCAKRIAELLNAYYIDDNFEKVATASAPLSVDAEDGCRSCHRKGADFEDGGWTRGKTDCVHCHSAPHLD